MAFFLGILQRLGYRGWEHIIRIEQRLDSLHDLGLPFGRGALVGIGSKRIDRLGQGKRGGFWRAVRICGGHSRRVVLAVG